MHTIVRRLAGEGSPLCADRDAARLLVQIWAEAARSPRIQERFQEAFSGAEAVIGTLIAEYQRRGLISPEVNHTQAARLLIGLLHGFVVQRALLPDAHPDTFNPGLAGLIFGGTS
ncbi:TetR family transcriptional regulator C-terminal domain-containing protein [Fodinicola feengrottensis]|uniref:TetR family transcriptional regulator C-terminal domain-containing protein n=1 Tax=Fodinicola feengrottensis TaxID=435914 RepID=UPI002441CA4C|nr:TetR family transcriptional regulator C-terminal domain-containing protein [Fodinicola feengrottensis]